jgi:hypothetical protein
MTRFLRVSTDQPPGIVKAAPAGVMREESEEMSSGLDRTPGAWEFEAETEAIEVVIVRRMYKRAIRGAILYWLVVIRKCLTWEIAEWWPRGYIRRRWV